jgi:hypothetical protein
MGALLVGAHQAEFGKQARGDLPQRIDVAPPNGPPRPRAPPRIDDGGLGRRYRGEQVCANPLANQTPANPAPHGAREVPGPPVLIAHARGGAHQCRAGAKTPRAAASPRKALPRRAGSREPPREPNFRKPGSARSPERSRAHRSPSRACEWPCLRGYTGARSRPG